MRIWKWAYWNENEQTFNILGLYTGLPWWLFPCLPKQEPEAQSPGQEEPVGNATHSSVLAWELSWTGEPGRLQSTGSQKELAMT